MGSPSVLLKVFVTEKLVHEKSLSFGINSNLFDKIQQGNK